MGSIYIQTGALVLIPAVLVHYFQSNYIYVKKIKKISKRNLPNVGIDKQFKAVLSTTGQLFSNIFHCSVRITLLLLFGTRVVERFNTVKVPFMDAQKKFLEFLSFIYSTTSYYILWQPAGPAH